jgi:hypothetical protein
MCVLWWWRFRGVSLARLEGVEWNEWTLFRLLCLEIIVWW